MVCGCTLVHFGANVWRLKRGNVVKAGSALSSPGRRQLLQTSGRSRGVHRRIRAKQEWRHCESLV